MQDRIWNFENESDLTEYRQRFIEYKKHHIEEHTTRAPDELPRLYGAVVEHMQELYAEVIKTIQTLD